MAGPAAFDERNDSQSSLLTASDWIFYMLIVIHNYLA